MTTIEYLEEALYSLNETITLAKRYKSITPFELLYSARNSILDAIKFLERSGTV